MTIWVVIAVAGGLWLVVCALFLAWLWPPPEADERHPVHTDDDWLLTLHRYRPAPGATRQPVPVVLGHGINMNRTCWELSPGGSLPRALAARGHDVFVAEYRGTPTSRPPLRGERRGRWDYDLLDHARYDLPAIIDTAARLAGSETVSWVGHSMGGILIYLYAAQHGSARLHRVVTLGSPVRFSTPKGLPGRLLPLGSWLVDRRSRLWLTSPAALALPALMLLRRYVLRWAFNPDHLTLREASTLCWTSLQDVSAKVTGFFVEMSRRRWDVCPDPSEGRDGYEPGGLRRLTAPLLVIAGRVDELAPPRSVEPAYHRAGSERAAFRCLGGDGSGTPTFGHSDLISGQPALRYVLPDLVGWLEGDDPFIVDADLERRSNAG